MTTLNQPKTVPQSRLRQLAPSLQTAERRWLLKLADLTLLSASLILAVVLRTELLPDASALIAYTKWFITLWLTWLTLANIFDLYNLSRSAAAAAIFAPIIAATAITAFVYTAIPWLTPPITNRAQTLIFFTASLTLLTGWRILYARIFTHPAFERRALIVGTGEAGQALLKTLSAETAHQNPWHGTGYIPLGFIETDPTAQTQTLANLPVLNDHSRLIRELRTRHIDELIIARRNTDPMPPSLMEVMLDCRELGITITSAPTIYERLTNRIDIDLAWEQIELTLESDQDAFQRLYLSIKRIGDFLGATLGLLPLAILYPIARLTKATPITHIQRVGRGGRPFSILKFHVGEGWFGRILRRTHLDGLPQIINVLRGEMSIIGPRPEHPEYVGGMARTIPFYRARHCVRPGITGWAQTHQEHGNTPTTARTELEYDLYYIRHASLLLDLQILLRTIAEVATLTGRTKNNNSSIHQFTN